MPPKIVLTQDLPAEQKERALMNGAVLVFGSGAIKAAAEISKLYGSSGGAIFAGERFEQLKLPDTLMLWAILVYAHDMPGPRSQEIGNADLSAWKDRLFDRVDFVKEREPMPTVEVNALKGTREVTLQLMWLAPQQGDWQGVTTNQIKRIAAQFEARYANAAAPPAQSVALPGRDWQRFIHPDSLFSIAHPNRWSEVPAVSDGASLSCASDDGSELMEVVVGKASQSRAQGDIADVFADGAVAQIKSFPGARIIHRNVVASGTGGRCLSLLAEHRENGLSVRSEYYIVSSDRDALYVALKCLSSSYAKAKPDFDKACASLNTPWLGATGHGGRRAGASGATTAAGEPVQPKPPGGLIWWVLASAVVAAAAAYFIFGAPPS